MNEKVDCKALLFFVPSPATTNHCQHAEFGIYSIVIGQKSFTSHCLWSCDTTPATTAAAAAGLPLTLFWHCPTARVQLQAHLAHLNCAQIGPFFALRTDRPITSSADCWRLELRAVSSRYLLAQHANSRAAGRPGIGPVRSGCVAIL